MRRDFHYNATYCAAVIAGYSHEEARDICWAANHADSCTRAFIASVGGPPSAATTQSKFEMGGFPMDGEGAHEVTRIWSAFHFLPKDLHPTFKSWRSKKYKQLYALICGPDSELVVKTVKLAKDQGVEAIGLAMHVLADTWAHMYFAGTPSMVINNRDSNVYEILSEDGEERKLKYGINLKNPNSIEDGQFVSTLFMVEENTVMNLGHGRIGSLPDYAYMRYRYRPAWKGGKYVVKDNPADYTRAFGQMVYAMKYLRGDIPDFEVGNYAEEEIAPYKDRIAEILAVRSLDHSEYWKAFGEDLTGQSIPEYEPTQHNEEFINSEEKHDTFLGRYFAAAHDQRNMVNTALDEAGITLAGKPGEMYWEDVPSQEKFLHKLMRMAFVRGGGDK